jgi:hypothetical protein
MSRRGSIVLGLAAVLIAGPVVAPATRAGELTETVFRKLHDELQPGPEELWRTIPWKIALLDAQQTAAKQQKPIFIWAMDGHPLGCT